MVDSNPYVSPTVQAGTSAAPSLSVVWLGRVACVTLFLLASMYVATILFAARVSITLTGMLGIADGTSIFCFKLIYTALLFACVVSHLRGYRIAAFISSVLVTVITASAVVRSLIVDYRPSFYEWYFGETVTVVAAVLLAVVTIWPRTRSSFHPEVSGVAGP